MVRPLRLLWVKDVCVIRFNLPPALWQNDRGLLRATVITRGGGGNGHRIRVSTQSWLWRGFLAVQVIFIRVMTQFRDRWEYWGFKQQEEKKTSICSRSQFRLDRMAGARSCRQVMSLFWSAWITQPEAIPKPFFFYDYHVPILCKHDDDSRRSLILFLTNFRKFCSWRLDIGIFCDGRFKVQS